MISDYLLADEPAYAEFLDRGAVARLLHAHAQGARRLALLLSILMLEIWLTSYLPRAVGAAAV